MKLIYLNIEQAHIIRFMSIQKIKLRKYKVYPWIIEDSICSKSSWTYGTCLHCSKSLRANQWEEHPNKCSKQPSIKSTLIEQKQNINEKKSELKQNEHSMTQQIINLMSCMLRSLLPKYLSQTYPKGLDFLTKSQIITRLSSACQKMVNDLSSPFQDGLSIEDLQQIIPKNYHTNLSNLLDNVIDMQNYPLLFERIQKMNYSQHTKNKYRKSLNLLAKKFKLGWKFCLRPENKQQKKRIRGDQEHEEQNKLGNLLGGSVNVEKMNKELSQDYYEKSYDQNQISKSQMEEQIFESNSEIQQQSKVKISFIANMNINKRKQKNQLQKIEIRPTKKQSLFSFTVKKLISYYEDRGQIQYNQLNQFQKKRNAFINSQNISLLITKCELCGMYNHDDIWWKCQVCNSFYCSQCIIQQNPRCICYNQKKEQLPDVSQTYFQQVKWELVQTVATLNTSFNQASNCLNLQQIQHLQQELQSLISQIYNQKFTRTSKFCWTKFDLKYVLNVLYDPVIKKANKSLKTLYKKYALGHYYPPIEVKFSQMGYGVYATKNIQKNVFLFEYSADVVSSWVSRGKGDKIMKLFQGPTSKSKLELNPIINCGIGPLLNHSQKPNVKVLRILIEDLPRVIFFSVQKINEGDQLLYNYNDGSNEYPVDEFSQQSSGNQDENLIKDKKKIIINSTNNNMLTSKGYAVMDFNNKFILKKNQNKLFPMASFIKVINLLTIFRLKNLNFVDFGQQVKIQWSSTTDSGTNAKLKIGEFTSLLNLIYAMIMQSANDAANNIALHTARKLSKKKNASDIELFNIFLQQIQITLNELNLKQIIVSDVSGYSSESECSPLNFCKIMKKIAENEQTFKFFKKQNFNAKFYTKDKKQYSRTFTSTNKLIIQKYYGKTAKAYQNVEAFSTIKEIKNQKYFFVVMSSTCSGKYADVIYLEKLLKKLI